MIYDIAIIGAGPAGIFTALEMLKKGSEVARAEAAKTLDEVRAAMKINYFDDMELIKAQAEKYKA